MGYCNHCRGGCFCGSNQASKGLTEAQSGVNRTINVPVEAPNNFELDKLLGRIPEDMTYDEWRATQKGEPGVDGKDGQGIQIKGNLPNYAALLAIVDPQPGDSYSVSGATPEDIALLYTYDAVTGWPAEGQGVPIQGEPGAPGTDGDTLIPIVDTNYFDI